MHITVIAILFNNITPRIWNTELTLQGSFYESKNAFQFTVRHRDS